MLIGQQVGPFEIERELGSGAMGTVFLARFQKNEERVVPVALKVISMGLTGNDGAMARFDREANILKQLRHPHIVKLVATGKYRQTPFIAMEYIDGEALDRALLRRGRLSWEEVVAYGKDLCSALQYAHEKGIIHRDLKPSNLMVTKEGMLKLTDFGIAKDTDVTALTGMNTTIGTAAYMSPEQCRGERNLTAKSDLYSLGVVFFELLTGRKPFIAENTVEMFLKHVSDVPPRPGKTITELPAKLEFLIMQLMEKDRDQRPSDAAWVGRMLAEIEEDAFARKSAGLDVATSRKPDRFQNQELDESDREAARALKGKKKRKKKAEKPKGQGVKIALIAISLGLLTVGAYFGLHSSSPDTLFAAIDNAPTPEAKLEAAERFLKAHGGKDGKETEHASRIYREGKVRERLSQLSKRFARGLAKPDEADDPNAYQDTWHAMEAEKAGDLKRAGELWAMVKARFIVENDLRFTFKTDELAKARWGWVASDRLARIEETRELEAKLRKDVEELARFPLYKLPYEANSPEGMAVKAFRLAAFSDPDKSASVWDAIITLTEKEIDQHVVYLLASQQRGQIVKSVGDIGAKRAQRLRSELKELETQLVAAKADSQNRSLWLDLQRRCRSIIDLYDDEPIEVIRGVVARARSIALEAAKK